MDACQLASCGAVAAMATACSKSPTAPGGNVTTLGTLSGQFSGGTVQVTVVGSALDGVGGAAVVESIAGLFLVARTAADAVVAIDAVCTHQGCTVNGIDGTIYVCPCHGSRYSRTGQVVNGPAPASLRQYTAAIAGGVVSITL